MAHPTNFSVSEAEKNVKLILYVFTFILGIAGNALVLVILGSKKRRTANDILIINLSVADVTLLLLSLPTNILWFGEFRFPEVFCIFVVPLMTAMFNVSIFTMTVMAVHRCHAIVNSFKPEVRYRHLLMGVGSTWLFGLFLLVPAMIVSESDASTGSCKENWDKNSSRTYTAVLFVLQYVLPLLTIGAAYILIGFELHKSKRRHSSSNAQDRLAVEKRKKEDIQIIKMLATIVVLFAVCMLPIQIAWLLLDYGSQDQQKVASSLSKFSDIVAYFQTFLNPIVYGTLTKYFRMEYVRVFKRLFCSACCGHAEARQASVAMSTPKSFTSSKEHAASIEAQARSGSNQVVWVHRPRHESSTPKNNFVEFAKGTGV